MSVITSAGKHGTVSSTLCLAAAETLLGLPHSAGMQHGTALQVGVICLQHCQACWQLTSGVQQRAGHVVGRQVDAAGAQGGMAEHGTLVGGLPSMGQGQLASSRIGDAAAASHAMKGYTHTSASHPASLAALSNQASPQRLVDNVERRLAGSVCSQKRVLPSQFGTGGSSLASANIGCHPMLPKELAGDLPPARLSLASSLQGAQPSLLNRLHA